MSDYGGDSDGDYGSDQEWLYVEDHYDEVDDLVEHTCPSPTIYDTHEFQEYDPYDYWEDLTYLSDGVYDFEKQQPKPKKLKTKLISKKRKRDLDGVASAAKRPRRVVAEEAVSPIQPQKDLDTSASESIVLWKSQEQREDITIDTAERNGKLVSSVAVLKDWREQFPTSSGLPVAITPPTDEEVMSHVDHEPATGDGFDLSDLQSVAALLSSHDIASILRSKGLDPDAIEVALQAMISGEEPEFEEEEEEEDERAEEHAGGDAAEKKEDPVLQETIATINAMRQPDGLSQRQAKSIAGRTGKR